MKCGRLTIDIDHEPMVEKPAEYSSEVKTYRLSPEELAKYGPVSKKRCLLCGKEKSLLHFTTGISGKTGAICHECIGIKKEGKTMFNQETKATEMRTCKKCGKTKPVELFCKGQMGHTCKECFGKPALTYQERNGKTFSEAAADVISKAAEKAEEIKAIELPAPEPEATATITPIAPKSNLAMIITIDGEGEGQDIMNRMANLQCIIAATDKYRFALTIEEVQD